MEKKRTYGTGSLRLRGRVWYIAYRQNGEQRWEKAGRDKGGAEALLHERLAAAKRDDRQAAKRARGGLIFGDVAAEWLKRRKNKPTLSPRTVEIDSIALTCHLIPAMGANSLDEITADVIDQYRDAKLAAAHPGHGKPLPVAGKGRADKPLSSRSVNQHLTVLNQVFAFAQRRFDYDDNPMILVERVAEESRLVEPLEPEEVRRLIAAISPRHKMLVSTLARLGLRMGEALALRGSDYVKKDRVLKIRRTLSRDGGKVRVGRFPKTRAGERDLVVTEHFHELLIAHMNERVHSMAGTRNDGLIFCNEMGDIINPSNFRTRVWMPAIKAAKLAPSVTPHHLRHTYASEQIAANEPDTVIAYRLGHRDSGVTRKIYGHIFARHRSKAADLSIYDDAPADVDLTGG